MIQVTENFKNSGTVSMKYQFKSDLVVYNYICFWTKEIAGKQDFYFLKKQNK